MINRTLSLKIYKVKYSRLMKYGIKKGLVLPFENEMWEALENVVYAGTPANMYLKYLRPVIPPGKCYDRSYVITMAFKDCFLVRGNNKDLELYYGKDNAGHGWVEKDGWCYDPSLMVKIKQELYYQIFQPTNVKRYHRSELEKDEFYQQCINGYIDRFSLLMAIPLIEEIARISDNQDFIDDVGKFKAKNNYDEATIINELDTVIRRVI